MNGTDQSPVRSPPGALSFVNVTFPGELPLLRLQARSMAHFMPRDLVGEVLNIVNAVDEKSALSDLEATRAEYGPHADRVRNITGSELFSAARGPSAARHWPRKMLAENPWIYFRRRAGWRGNDGWQMQQAMKLAAARLVSSDIYVILDSKNVFVAPISYADFVAEDGKPRARLDHGPADHAARWLRASLKALGLDEALMTRRPLIDILTPSGMKTRVVIELLASLEARHGSVQNVFAMPWNRATEFMLVSAWCLNAPGGVPDHFAGGLMDPHNLNYRHGEDFRMRRAQEATEAGAKLVTPHRAVLTSLSDDLRERLTAIFADRGLIGGATEMQALIDEIRLRNPGLPRQ
jgi:hypothetical protein